MFNTQVTMITENAVVKVGKFAYVGTKRDLKTTHKLTGLVHYHFEITPYLMRLRDRNKYPKPHQSTKRKGSN